MTLTHLNRSVLKSLCILALCALAPACGGDDDNGDQQQPHVCHFEQSFTASACPTQLLNTWANEAQSRSLSNPNSRRFENLQPILITANTWGGSETIMSPRVSERFIESVDRLDLRYPFAVPNAFFAYDQVKHVVRDFDARAKRDGAQIKGAALRFLHNDSNLADITDYSMSNLSEHALIALAWAAINDSTIFTTPTAFSDRVWGMIQAFANIQRAHNDRIPNANGEYLIRWTYPQEQDISSCTQGTFKRTLEHLHGAHPDVVIYDPIIAPSDSDVTEAMNRAHQALVSNFTSEQKVSILRGAGQGDPDNCTDQDRAAATAYQNQLIVWMQRELLNAPETQVRRIVTLNVIQWLDFEFPANFDNPLDSE